jgi:hypothetical protein
MRNVTFFLALICLLTAAVSAQTTSGSIVGAIVDPTGAVVSGAQVTITNLDTGAVFKTSSDSSGNYVATPLAIGRYSVVVEAPGFKKAVGTNITLNVQDRLGLNFHLQLGAISESVSVLDAAPLLQTDSSTLGQVVNSQSIDDLPLNGRYVTKLAVLTAGVVPTTTGAFDSKTGGFSANGVRPYQNNYMLDGVDNNSIQSGGTSGSSYVVSPPPDAVAEFKLQTNSMSAEFGRSAGGVMNVTLKSGTNKFHGSLFEFFRNSALDAKNYFDSAADPIPQFKQNQFGGTLGGPVTIPGVYDGKNRTFFFFDYQGTRIRKGLTLFATVPLPAWKTGDFSGFNPIYDPSTTTVVNGVATRQPFQNNQIPLSRFDPVALELLNEFPNPNVPGDVSLSGVSNNYLSHPSLQDDSDGFDVRIDHKISDSDSVFFRFSYYNDTNLNPGSLPAPIYDGQYTTGTDKTIVRTGVLSYTRVFTSRTINELKTSYLYNNSALRGFNADVDGAAQLGIPGIPFTPGNGGLPTFGVSGINGFGGSPFSPTIEVQNEFLLMDNLTLVRGAHTLKLGFETRPRVNFSFDQPIAPRGWFTFSGDFTRDPNNIGGTGLGSADFALGALNFATITSAENNHFQEPAYFAFVQDDYKVNRKLTVNLGLRYEFVSNAMEKNNAQANFNLDTLTLDIVKGRNDPLPSNFDFANVPVNRNASRTLVPNNKLNFAPRIGFAYNFMNKTVLHGGYGIFYSSFEFGPLSDPNPGLNPPFHRQSTFTAPSLVTPNPTVSQLSAGFPDTALSNPDSSSFFAISPHLRNPYVQDWNLSVERELGWNTVFSIAYAGSRGNKQYEFRDANQPLATADPTLPLDPRRPLPYLGQGLTLWCSCGFSTYHSLQTKLDKRFSNGLSFLAAYTYGKTIDERSQASYGIGSNDGFRDATRHPEWEKGLADFDVRHRFVFSYSYALPVGRGKTFGANLGKFANTLVGGWEFVGVTAFQTGFPFTITSSTNTSHSTGQNRPDPVPGVSLIPAHQGPNEWYNPAALQEAVLGTYGSLGRNALEGPGQINVDFSLFKNFEIAEGRELQFRGEFFNLVNHPNFQGNSIQLTFDQAGAGQISAANASRQIQLGLKLYF